MIADDNDRMRETIKKMIRKKAAVESFCQCTNGREAVEQYKAYHPDYVLMDIMMKPLNGLDAAEKIKCLDPEAKIIIVTGYDEPAYREAAQALGVHAFLLKEELNKISEILTNNV